MRGQNKREAKLEIPVSQYFTTSKQTDEKQKVLTMGLKHDRGKNENCSYHFSQGPDFVKEALLPLVLISHPEV